MKRFCICLLSALSLTAQAEVYKSIGPDGTVIFTDQPTEGAEKVYIPPVPTYSAPKLPEIRTREETETQTGAARYSAFAIASPAPEATIRDNTGSVPLRLRIEPALQTDLGHRIQYQVDGVDQQEPTAATGITFSNLDRGSHTLSAKLLDADGAVLKSAAPVTIFVHRPSVNLPARQ
jgi:hypothetical protein